MSGMGFTSLDGWPSSGVDHVRIWDIGVTWRDIHVGVDAYDWSRLDAVVAQIESIGARMTYVRIDSIVTSIVKMNIGYWWYASMARQVSRSALLCSLDWSW